MMGGKNIFRYITKLIIGNPSYMRILMINKLINSYQISTSIKGISKNLAGLGSNIIL